MRCPRPTALSASAAVSSGSEERGIANVQRNEHVLDGGERREQVVALNTKPTWRRRISARFFEREADGLVARQMQLAAGRGQDAAEDREQRCLAAAGRAHPSVSSPGRRSMLTPFRMCSSPAPVPIVLTMLRASRSGCWPLDPLEPLAIVTKSPETEAQKSLLRVWH